MLCEFCGAEIQRKTICPKCLRDQSISFKMFSQPDVLSDIICNHHSTRRDAFGNYDSEQTITTGEINGNAHDVIRVFKSWLKNKRFAVASVGLLTVALFICVGVIINRTHVPEVSPIATAPITTNAHGNNLAEQEEQGLKTTSARTNVEMVINDAPYIISDSALTDMSKAKAYVRIAFDKTGIMAKKEEDFRFLGIYNGELYEILYKGKRMYIPIEDSQLVLKNLYGSNN